LQITQFYDGAVQPSTLAAQIAGALFYGATSGTGAPVSTVNLLGSGHVAWNEVAGGDSTGVATDLTGTGASALFTAPDSASGDYLLPFVDTDFFTVFPAGSNSPVSRTTGLLQAGDDPFHNTGQWPDGTLTLNPGNIGVGRFAVNPIDPSAMVISSSAGRLFSTSGPSTGYGVQWFPIANPTDLDGSYAYALAYGAPSAPGNVPLDNFIYAGTTLGNVFVTFTGGGVGSPWKKLTAPDGSSVMEIAPDPARGSTDLYVVTLKGVYYMADSTSATPTWQNITGNLFSPSLAKPLYNDPNNTENTLQYLTSIVPDWRYAIPNDPTAPISVNFNGTGSVTFSYNGVPAPTAFNFTPATAASDLMNYLNTIPALKGVVQVTGSSGSFTVSAPGGGFNPDGLSASSGTLVTLTPGASHPVLYAGGEGGVFRSLDDGQTWTYFPDVIDGASQDGGYLPNSHISRLQLAIGNVNPGNGVADQQNGYNLLMASTFGTGAYAIRLNSNVMVDSSPLATFAVNPVEGPHVVSITSSGPSTPGGTDITGITVTFNSTVDPFTFTLSKVGSVIGPNGLPVTLSNVIDITPLPPAGQASLHNIYELVFATPQTTPGFYKVTLGPDISDYAGNEMDQNQNFINGEIPGDVYTGRVLLQNFANNAPVLTGTAATLSSIVENEPDTANPGTSVAAIVASLTPTPGITDPDNGASPGYASPQTAPIGIAVTGVNDANGTWQYSLDNGTTWTNFVNTSLTSATLLEANNGSSDSSDFIRFRPNSSYGGSATFTFRAWDETSGLAPITGADGATADVSGLSSGTIAAGGTGYSVNDLLTVQGGVSSSPAEIKVTAVGSGGTITAFQIVQAGSLYTTEPTMPAGVTGGTGTGATFNLTPGGGSTSFSNTSAKATISVNGVNTAPTFTASNPPTVNQNSGATTVPNWATYVPGGTGSGEGILAYHVLSVSNPSFFSVAPSVDNSGNLTYTPAPTSLGTVTFTLDVQDTGGTAGGGQDTSSPQTFTITVAFVNQPPIITAANPPTVIENSGAASVPHWATFTPGIPGETLIGYTVTNVGNTSLFSVQPTVSNNGTLTYTPAANMLGTSTFTITARESGGTANGGNDTSAPQAFTITVSVVNQPPSFTAGNPPAVDEDTGNAVVPHWATFIANPNVPNQTLLAYHVTAVSNPSLFSVMPAVDSNGNLTYTPDTDTSGTSTFTVDVQGSGGTANGGQDTSTPQTFTITVNFVNQAPSFFASYPPTVNEDSGPVTLTNWATYAPGPGNDAGESFLAYHVTNVGNPSLFSVLPSVDNNGTLTYTPAPNVLGTSSFSVTSQDTGGTANGGVDTSDPQTFAITVAFVNQPPILTATNPPAVNENSPAVTLTQWATFTPGIAGETFLGYNLANISNPALFSSLPTLNNNGTLTYTPTANMSGTSTFTVTAQESGGTVNGGQDTSAPQTFTITVNFINQPPSFTASNPPAINENNGPVTLSHWATYTPGLGNSPGEGIKAYNVTNVGNASLFSVLPTIDNSGNLTYTPALNQSGTSSFSVNVQDSGGTANGGQDTSPTQIFTITVNFINQAPTFTASNPPVINENFGPVTITNWANYVPTGNSPQEALLAYHISNISNPALFSALPAIDNNGTLTYTPTSNVLGMSTFTVTAQDIGGTANGGHDTSAPQTFTVLVAFVNLPPTLTATNPPAVNENSGGAAVIIWASFSPGSPGDTLIGYQVTNVGNPSLFSTPPAVDASGNLTYTLAPNQSGTSTFTTTVQETGGTANGGQDTSTPKTFTITVNFVNQPPSFTAVNPPVVNENTGQATVTNWATFVPGAGNAAGEALLAYHVSNVSNAGLFSVQPSIDTNGTLTYTPAANVQGTSTFTVAAQDTGGTANGGQDTSAPQTFTITVNFVNQPPSFAASSPPSVNENSGPTTIANWATFSPDPLLPSETVLAYHVSAVSNAALFSAPPTVANNGTLTYAPAANLSGTFTFTVTVQETGGTANGGQDTSAPQTFTITVNFVNQAPTFTANNPPAVDQNNGPATVTNWATFVPGSGNPANDGLLAYHVTAVGTPSLFSVPPTVNATGTLTYTPATGATGTSTFTVTAQDSGGTANGGHDTSAPQTFTIQVQGAPTPLSNQELSYTQGNLVINLNPGATYQLQQAGTPAYFLAHNLGLYFTGNYSQNYGGTNAKWLKGNINQFQSPWYFIQPSGQIYAWDGTPGKASGALVGTVDPVYWQNPPMLWNATNSTYAFALQQGLGLFFTGNFYQNFDGIQERWLQGNGGLWYYITPNGNFYTGSGTFLASLDEIYYNEPARLYNAQNLNQSVNVTLVQGNSPTLTITPINQYVGGAVVQLITTFGTSTTVNQFNVTVDNHMPVLNPISNQTISHSSGANPLPVTLTATDADHDSLTYTATAGTLGYVLQTQYNLSFGGSYYTNSLGLNQNEKWIKGNLNQYNNPWYFILPNGQFYAWNKTSPIQGQTPLATLDPAYYLYPTLLYQNSAGNDLAYAIKQQLGLHIGSSGLFFNYYGQSESWLQDSSGAYYLVFPNGQLYKWGGTASLANDTLLATFAPQNSINLANHLVNATPNAFSVSVSGNTVNVAPTTSFIGDIWVLAGVTDDANNPLNRRFVYQSFKTQVTV